jgi:hypothetical protein
MNGKCSLVKGVAMDPHSKRGHDLYETPPGAVRALLKVEHFTGTTWEPCCGPGSIVRVLRETGHHVIATDLIDYSDRGWPADATGGVDFLQVGCAPEGVTTILTNPPYKNADNFVRHALTLAPRVVMFLRLLALEGQGRSDIVDGGRLARVHVFRNRVPRMHRDGWEGPRSESNGLCFGWFCWDRDRTGAITLDRITYEASP